MLIDQNSSALILYPDSLKKLTYQQLWNCMARLGAASEHWKHYGSEISKDKE